MKPIMQKEILWEQSEILYSTPFSHSSFQKDWKVCSGEWWLEGEWLTGKNPGNYPGVILSRQDFTGNILMEFEARTVAPCTHDINFMWNCSWDEEHDKRGIAYVAGLQGWWKGKVGIEKSPDYALNAGTPLYHFVPGKTIRIAGGSIDGHCFIYADGELLLELTDTQPIDSLMHARVGFEAYCSYIQVRNLTVRRIKWKPDRCSYSPEF